MNRVPPLEVLENCDKLGCPEAVVPVVPEAMLCASHLRKDIQVPEHEILECLCVCGGRHMRASMSPAHVM